MHLSTSFRRWRWAWLMWLWFAIPAASVAQTLTFTNSDIYPVAKFLNEAIAEGHFQTVSSGANQFTLAIPGRDQPVAVELTIPTIELRFPGLYARLPLKSLRFRHFTLHFDEARQALRLRIYFHNQRNGIVGYYKVGPIRHSLRLHVKRARLDVYFKPTVERGELRFHPLDVELSFYEGKIPGFIRPVVNRAVKDAVVTGRSSLQRQFESYIPELLTAIYGQWENPSILQQIVIEEGQIQITVD